MPFYNHLVSEKAYKQFTENDDDRLVATVNLMPHRDYSRDNVYKFTGLGSMFNGTYRFRKVVHTINPSGYTVEAEARMVFDSKGFFVETKGYKSEQATKPKAPTQTKGDKVVTVKKGDTLWDIAAKYCRSPMDWKEIEKANHKLLITRDKRNISDKGHWIYPVQKITIPGKLLK